MFSTQTKKGEEECSCHSGDADFFDNKADYG